LNPPGDNTENSDVDENGVPKDVDIIPGAVIPGTVIPLPPKPEVQQGMHLESQYTKN
jgi:hypothetical protein